LVSAEDVEHGKPDPEGYRHALVELNRAPGGADRLVHPHEVLAVEDSPAGATAAAGAGLRVAALGAVVGGTIAAEPLASLSLLTPEWLSGRF